MSLTVPPT